MITDEERREIAERLMEPKESLWTHADAELNRLDELIRLRHDVGCQHGQDIYERLADLIDRQTCTIVDSWQGIEQGFEEFDLSGMYGFELSCGHIVHGYDEPDYCSMCGAKVVGIDY